MLQAGMLSLSCAAHVFCSSPLGSSVVLPGSNGVRPTAMAPQQALPLPLLAASPGHSCSAPAFATSKTLWGMHRAGEQKQSAPCWSLVVFSALASGLPAAREQGCWSPHCSGRTCPWCILCWREWAGHRSREGEDAEQCCPQRSLPWKGKSFPKFSGTQKLRPPRRDVFPHHSRASAFLHLFPLSSVPKAWAPS